MTRSHDGLSLGAPARPPVGTLEDLRRQNLSTVLSLSHSRGSISRAELARATGLNRSTIGVVVSELQRHGLVELSEAEGTGGVGRPSAQVRPTSRHLAVAVHPEVDTISIGVTTLGGHVVRKFRFDVERTPLAREVVNTVAAVIDGLRMDLSEDRVFVGIGLAVPGLMNMRDGVVRVAPHLGWRDEPLVASMIDATGLPVWAANDATCGVIAEAQFGAAVGVTEAIYVNGGSAGIGGGVIVGGSLLTGRNGYGGEVGHLLVNSSGQTCHCGRRGCLETEVSRSRLLGAFGLARADDADLHDMILASYGQDPVVTSEVDRQMTYIRIALTDLTNLLDPERVIFGGYLSALGALELPWHSDEIDCGSLRGSDEAVEVVASTMSGDATLIGAAELVLQKILDDPLEVSTGGGYAMPPARF